MSQAKSAAPTRRKSPPPVLKGTTERTSAAHTHAYTQFQNAMQWMQQGKYEKSCATFEALMNDGPVELVERSRVYLAACKRHVAPPARKFVSDEEQYDYAISLVNTGYYEEAREQLENILARTPGADFALYGLAVLNSMTGAAEACLETLTRAIELNPRNRIQARSDSDFQEMADDPRFTELLYPEIG
jgi:tetratricopeptide (TPR) repeat protein